MTDDERLQLLGLLAKHITEHHDEDDLNAESTVEEIAESIAGAAQDGPAFAEAISDLMGACGLETA